MSIAMLTNILTMMLCFAVLVQSVRMIRSLRAVKDGGLTDTVKALDKATGEARAVLSEMKRTLGESSGIVRNVEKARALHDELSVMVGIADGAAERIVEAMDAARAARPAPPVARPRPKPAAEAEPAQPATRKRRASAQPEKAAEPAPAPRRASRKPAAAAGAPKQADSAPALDLAQVLKMAASA